MSFKIKAIDMNYFFCFLIAIWLIFPKFYRNSSNIYVLIITFLWLFTAFLDNKTIQYEKCFFFLSVWIIYIVFYRAIGFSQIKIINLIKQIYFWFPQFMFCYYKQRGDSTRNRRLIYFITFAAFLSLCVNSYLLYRYPNASVDINFESGMHLQTLNIGTTGYSFYAAVIIICSICLLFKSKKKYTFTLLIAIALIFCLQMGRAITIIVLIMGLYLLLYFYKSYKKGIWGKCIWAIMIFVPILIGLLFYNEIVSLLVLQFGHTRFIDRLMEVGNLFFHANNRSLQSGALRMSFFKVSINTWLSSLSSFFIGIGYPDLDQSENLSLIAGHSEIFDFLGAYGIVGVSIYCLLIFSFFKLVYDCASEKIRYFAVVVIFMTLTYALLNGLSGTPVIGLALFLVFPLILCGMEESR